VDDFYTETQFWNGEMNYSVWELFIMELKPFKIWHF